MNKTYNMITKINEFRKYKSQSITESNTVAMLWDEYCGDLFGASGEECEKALAKTFDQEEIEGFKAAKYYVLGKVISPDFNKRAASDLNRTAKAPAGTMMLDSENFFDKQGSLIYAKVACEGDGLAPYSIDFDSIVESNKPDIMKQDELLYKTVIYKSVNGGDATGEVTAIRKENRPNEKVKKFKINNEWVDFTAIDSIVENVNNVSGSMYGKSDHDIIMAIIDILKDFKGARNTYSYYIDTPSASSIWFRIQTSIQGLSIAFIRGETFVRLYGFDENRKYLDAVKTDNFNEISAWLKNYKPLTSFPGSEEYSIRNSIVDLKLNKTLSINQDYFKNK